MRTRRLELPRLTAPASKTGVSTISPRPLAEGTVTSPLTRVKSVFQHFCYKVEIGFFNDVGFGLAFWVNTGGNFECNWFSGFEVNAQLK